jgi:hypothetical protein
VASAVRETCERDSALAGEPRIDDRRAESLMG